MLHFQTIEAVNMQVTAEYKVMKIGFIELSSLMKNRVIHFSNISSYLC